MTLPHEQDADATEIARLRAEIEKLKADNSKIAMEALSVEGELDAASGSLYNRTRELMEAKARIKEADLQIQSVREECAKIALDYRGDHILADMIRGSGKRLCSGGECKLEDGHDGDHVVNLKRRCPHLYTKHDFGALLCADCGQPLMR